MNSDNASFRWRRSMTAKVVAMLTLGTFALAGCGAIQTDQARHLSESEAQQMAVSRFKNYNAGTRAITATIRDSADVWTIKGWYDFENDVGYASLTDTTLSTPSPEPGPASAVLLWSKHLLFSQSADGLEGKKSPPLPAPAVDEIKQTWNFTQYQPNLYAPQAALLIIASLGFDRPENPLLLQQSDALWLRDDHIGKTHVNVFAGPTSASVGTATPSPDATPAPDASTVRYWLNDSGLMLRVEMRLGGTKWSSVDLQSVPRSEKPRLPELGSLAPTEQ
jgi:hypothetical protein